MFKKIVCALDGSEHALKAARTACSLAAESGGELTFLTVTKELKMTEEVRRYIRVEHLSEIPQYVLDEMTEKIMAEAKDCARESGIKSAKTEVRMGHPARAIVDFAKRAKADLVVIGSRGLGDLEGVFLGSVSHKVATLAPCTCMIVK
jgi:nucleotide-binding universal stress UspA family protein